jgi:hypothetical protein
MPWKFDELLRWIGMEADVAPRDGAAARPPRVKTQLSATVFSGEPDEWVAYLNRSREQRYTDRIRVAIRCLAEDHRVEFRPKDEVSKPLASCLDEAFTQAREKAREKKFVLQAMDRMVFGNASNRRSELELRISPSLPCDASREVLFDDELLAKDVTIVLRASHVEAVLPAFW